MPIISRESGILVTPDPVYSKALKDPMASANITELYRGELTQWQADLLNEWTDELLEYSNMK